MLPALADLVLDDGAPGFVGQAARESMGLDLDSEQGTVAYLGYRPTSSCTVLWSLPSASGSALLLSGRLLRNGRGAGIPARPSARRTADCARAVTGNRASPCHYLPERQLLLEAFPMDVKLRGMPLAASRPWVEARLLPALGLSGREARLMESEPLSYKPWQRCTFRYGLEGRTGPVRYFGKLFHDEQGEVMLDRLQALDARLRAAEAPWEIAAPVAYLRPERMLVTSAIGKGKKLSRWLRPARKQEEVKAGLLGYIARAAEGLRFLQQTPADGLPRVAPRDLVAGFRRSTTRFPQVAPRLAAGLERSLQGLERAADQLPAEPLVPTHGAFRLHQLLPCDGKLGVLDLDTLCRSGASADAGNFLAYLDVLALRRPRLEALLGDCANAFLEALGPSPDRSGWLSWYRAASLVKVAFRCFLRLAPGWPETSRALLREADEQLARLGP